MEYVSTSSTGAPAVNFREMFCHPVAPDGGIYMPRYIPVIPEAVFKNLEGMSLTDCAYIIMTAFLGQDISASAIREATFKALNFDVPLQRLSDSVMALELFHGPTLGVRDIGTRFLASLISQVSDPNAQHPFNIIAATAGDTGMALADAMKEIPGAHVYIMHPRDVSGRDKRAGFSLSGDNATSMEIKGSLDQCMNIMHQLLADRDFISANSLICGNTLNLLRLLPLVVPFFHARAQMHRNGTCKPNDTVVFAIPSGSLALLTAGVIAKRMGLGNVRFVVACSPRHSFSHYLRTGETIVGNTQPSIAGALDVSYPGNLPRLHYLYGNSSVAMSQDIAAEEITDQDIVATMNEMLTTNDYLTEPHTAATMCALKRQLRPGEKGVILASVHPAKFGNIVFESTNTHVVAPKRMERIRSNGSRRLAIPPTLSALKKFLREQNLK